MPRTLRSWTTPLILGAVLASFLGTNGCSCDGDGGLGDVKPEILALPNPVVFDRISVNIEASVQLMLKNDGNAVLEITGEPVLAENAEDGETELILRRIMLPVDCGTGAERVDDTPNTVDPGECVSVDVVYIPANLGPDTGTITVQSNDPDTPTLVVPIDAVGAAPDIEVCVLPSACSAESVCYEPGSGPLTMDFGLLQINDTATCPVSINNRGELPLANLDWSFKSGNRRGDYSLDPTDLGSGGDLEPGAGIIVNIEFSPRSGGPKDAVVEITSTDPDEAAVTIHLDGMGDGPKVCPDPFPAIDFGQVIVGTTDSIDVTLENCGTMQLSITAMEVQNQNGTGPSTEFALGAGAPGVPIDLAAGTSAAVPVEFTPPIEGYFTGRLYLESTDPVVPSGWVNIVGEGVVPPSCELQASTSTVSFGTAAPSGLGGTPVEKTLALSNPGELDCTGVTANITAGAAATFSIVGLPAGGPPWTLTPGTVVIFTLAYDPADTTGPDLGTVSFGANELAAPLDVNLTGTPVSAPSCDLAVTPATGNFSFNECALLSFTPRVAQFGAVKMGSDKTLPVSLENIGTRMCTVASATFQAAIPFFPPDPTFTLPNGGVPRVNGVPSANIAPGQVGTIDVLYTPVSEAANCGALWVQTDNVGQPSECLGITPAGDGCYNISMMGQGVRSAIEVIPGDVDFGVITVGCASRDTNVTVYNIGQAPMVLNNIYVDPATAPFSIVSAPPTPHTVPGGGSITIRMKYQPPDTNTHTGLLVLESDAQNGNYFTVPLEGKGTNDPHQTDTFQQLSEPMVDVLWVIDNSCSMSEEQSAIANNGNFFLSHALSLSTDFQIGVTSTDMEDPNHAGHLLGNPKIITRTTPNAVSAFGNNVDLGTGGSATEKGLDATHSALTDPLITDPAANGGFLRDDAKLVVIAVSDEADQSTPPVDFYVDFLKNIKGYRNTDLMSFSAIVGYDEQTNQPSQCTSANGDAASGPRYVEVATRTGGLKRSICSSNWGQIADDLGLDAFGARTEFFLTREPIPSTIVVKVNGVTVQSAGNWSYDGSTNSVVFDPAAVPAQGATIVVDYDTICR
ncbi:MAG: choice-of-anchor D domain-containing protein [Deltaproteobacteria bacterium]|nr:choice-of-anchor D domain-containing protein [Deltaproteobacteria bacterium]